MSRRDLFSTSSFCVCVCLPYCHSIAPADTAGMLVLAFLFGACLADGLWLDDGPRAVVHWENPAAAGTTQKKREKLVASEKVLLFIKQTVVYIVQQPYMSWRRRRGWKKIQSQDICTYTHTPPSILFSREDEDILGAEPTGVETLAERLWR